MEHELLEKFDENLHENPQKSFFDKIKDVMQ